VDQAGHTLLVPLALSGVRTREYVNVVWRAVLLLVLVLADLAMWAIAFLGALAENCYGDTASLGCSSFAKHTAVSLGIVGIIVIVAVVGGADCPRRTEPSCRESVSTARQDRPRCVST
jgi:hypothetical protein